MLKPLMAMLHCQYRRIRREDGGGTAIEWAIFAILALAVAGAVAGAIKLAIDSRTPQIK